MLYVINTRLKLWQLHQWDQWMQIRHWLFSSQQEPRLKERHVVAVSSCQ